VHLRCIYAPAPYLYTFPKEQYLRTHARTHTHACMKHARMHACMNLRSQCHWRMYARGTSAVCSMYGMYVCMNRVPQNSYQIVGRVRICSVPPSDTRRRMFACMCVCTHIYTRKYTHTFCSVLVEECIFMHACMHAHIFCRVVVLITRRMYACMSMCVNTCILTHYFAASWYPYTRRSLWAW
jgi:hypothetical protein